MLVVLVLTAGCLAPGAATTDEPAPLPAAREAFFHSTMTLAAAAEPEPAVVRTGSFFSAWAAGEDYPTWYADPVGQDVLVTGINVTLFLQVTGPVVESARFPDIMVYASAGDAWMGYGERRDLSAFQPGQVYELDVEIGLPPGGLWLAPDVGLGLKVVPVMLQQDEQADVEILLGGETASAARWELAPLALPPVAREERDDATGEVVGTIYAGAAAPPTTSARVPLALPEDAVYVLAWMNTTENVGIPDIDLSIEAPNGTTITGSGTPTPREAIRVAVPNLAGAGDYALVVTTAGSPRATFSVEWVVGRSA